MSVDTEVVNFLGYMYTSSVPNENFCLGHSHSYTKMIINIESKVVYLYKKYFIDYV